MKLISIITLIVILTISLYAKPKIWVEQSFSIWNGPVEKIHSSNSIFVETGMFGTANISKIVKDDPKALKFAKISSDYDTTAKWWFWPSLTMGLYGILGSLYNQGQPGMEVVGAVSASILLIGLGVSIVKVFKSRYYLYRSINQYNGVYQESVSSLLLDHKIESLNYNPNNLVASSTGLLNFQLNHSF